MKSTTLCLFIATILLVSIQVNESAPAKTPIVVAKPDAPVVVVKPNAPVVVVDEPPKIKLAGSRTEWSTKIDTKAKKIFNDYKKIIAKKLQTEHKVPAKFVPKADKMSTQVVSGTLYHYLVKVPGNKYAFVTVAHQGWKKDQYGKPENVSVRPKLYALTETKF